MIAKYNNSPNEQYFNFNRRNVLLVILLMTALFGCSCTTLDKQPGQVQSSRNLEPAAQTPNPEPGTTSQENQSQQANTQDLKLEVSPVEKSGQWQVAKSDNITLTV